MKGMVEVEDSAVIKGVNGVKEMENGVKGVNEERGWRR